LHRDIKPSNVLVTEVDGAPVPKVIDFGIAKAMHSGSLADLTMFTHEDQVIGTPVYMSPEQIEGGRRLDARSDVYALGALLYEMLASAQPFDTTSIREGGLVAVKQLILETNPERPSTRLRQKTSPSKQHKSVNPARLSALPADLDWITMKALEKDRLRRYQTAAELAADVQRHLDNLPVLARPPSLTYKAGRWLRRHRRGVALASLGAAVATACIFMALHMEAESRRPRRITLSPGELYTNNLGMKFTPVPGTDVLMCIHETRNKDFAAYAAEVPGAVGLWLTGVTRGLDPVVEDRDNHPAMRIDWEEADAFCKWLSQKEGRTYRLPTDREWSIAAGIGDKETWTPDTTPKSVFKVPDHYPWEGAWPPPPGAGNYSDETLKAATPSTPSYIKGYRDGYATTAPVMSFRPNKLGLYDMGGNVSEWVEERQEPGSRFRILRGAHWGSHLVEDLRMTMASSARHFREVTTIMKAPQYGFRCVLEAAPPSSAALTPVPVAREMQAPDSKVGLQLAALPPGKFPDPLPDAEIRARGVTNSLGMKFIPVPGSDVLFCVHETRRQDYAAFAAASPGISSSWSIQAYNGLPISADKNHPVISVSWESARAFCDWLSRRENRLYRLPTDREWSIAAGLGPHEKPGTDDTPEKLGGAGRTEFPWGALFPPPAGMRAGNYADRAKQAAFPLLSSIGGYDDGFVTTAPVMSFEANPFGLHDLGGNVAEWCGDWFNAAFVERVYRGSGWLDDQPQNILSAARRSAKPSSENIQLGFRCVLVPGGKAPPEEKAAAPLPPVEPPHPAAISALQARQQPSFPVDMPPDDAKARAITNTLGMKLVPVPGTSVLFCIHETRRQDYAAYAADNPEANTEWKEHQTQGYTPDGLLDAHPVTRISWQDAQAFCVWLSRKENRTYRLPSDREWSIAAGIGSQETWDEHTTPASVFKPKGHFPWGGTTWPPAAPVVNYSDETRRRLAPDPTAKYFTGYDDGHAYTAPVM
ncbi:MAG: SUMF1/EgtB/PvdO family nonheme iron enzyme, partial [Prosthecobacter sp.]|uniref:bifunctional serine/threonine-protein kinase/formylglycine-generating enzyme family protein n=1 Tax=Prosthecobacter sp. TaxID=1965333 RepID=UPI001A0E7B7B